jgi:hypothetical protein
LTKNFSLAFQIKNDIDNFKKDLSDFKNGNYTLPVIYYFMENSNNDIDFNNSKFQKYIDISIEKMNEIKIRDMTALAEHTDYLRKKPKLTYLFFELTNTCNLACKHCGSSVGFFTKLTGVQYYTNTGDEDGYTVDSQNTSVYCRSCKKRVCSFEEFRKGASNGY